jgi:hypothetical protein
MDSTLEFPSSSSTPWCAQSRESDVASVIFPNSSELLSNSGELFRRRRSSLAKGEHTIAFVSSFPFRFAVELYAVMCSVTRIRRCLRHLPQLRRAPLQLRRALSSPLFIFGQRWAHHRVRLVVSFPFCHSRARLDVIPIKSPSLSPSLFADTMTGPPLPTSPAAAVHLHAVSTSLNSFFCCASILSSPGRQRFWTDRCSNPSPTQGWRRCLFCD